MLEEGSGIGGVDIYSYLGVRKQKMVNFDLQNTQSSPFTADSLKFERETATNGELCLENK